VQIVVLKIRIRVRV